MSKKEDILKLFPGEFRERMYQSDMSYDQLNEISLRVGQPVIFRFGEKERVLTKTGLSTEIYDGICCNRSMLNQLLSYAGNYSLYAYEEELKNGYLTVQGGHRIGICGRTVLVDGKVKTVMDVNSVNIRVAHEIFGCADEVLPKIFEKGFLKNTLFISPPGNGKTTLLRDCIRQISNGTKWGKGLRVSVIDERCEIAASYRGAPQNQLGIRTSIMDCCPKPEGIQMVLRSMSPQVIAVDEIGSELDMQALLNAGHAGCRILATIHGDGLSDIQKRPAMGDIIREGVFQRYVQIGQVHMGVRPIEIFNKEGILC